MIIELEGILGPREVGVRAFVPAPSLEPGVEDLGAGKWLVRVARNHRDAGYLEQERHWMAMIEWGRENSIDVGPKMTARNGEPFWEAEFTSYGDASLFFLRWS